MTDAQHYGPLLPRSFFARRAESVAPELVGAVAVAGAGRDTVAVRITEVEAYAGPRDPASHAFRRTARSEVMYGEPGHLYVYFIYGMHWCANIVTGPDGDASAVLLRAGAVLTGLDAARLRRPSARKDADLARGPAGIARVLGLTGELTGADLCRPGRPFAVRAGTPVTNLGTGPRVGISVAADVRWRFWDADSPTVSAYRAGVRRRRKYPDQAG
ncbi:DNA-3-methyladenine glycosylase [Nakamurella lactea]|uniref:DNA-3-methyladenine glycosylase n=1 Tax=Nakamurella lactea TaxID=459515 RepID=UPI0004112610|nr:DNA-3-methyladenine glycosylase [Nakamurella lactea]